MSTVLVGGRPESLSPATLELRIIEHDVGEFGFEFEAKSNSVSTERR